MDGTDTTHIYAATTWFRQGNGPRYRQLYKHLTDAILSGDLPADSQLPPERDLAELADVSRVTVRRAVGQLVADGLVDQRRGAGSFVRPAAPRLEQSLSSLVSFTENMQARGLSSSSVVLAAGLHVPSPTEMVTLGIASHDNVARVQRLRSANGTPMAIETSSLPADILPNPGAVETSLYAVLRRADCAPTRAIQRVAALNISGQEAQMLGLPEGAAVLQIDRTGYLASGRPIEFTRGLYRSDMYDFVSELRLE